MSINLLDIFHVIQFKIFNFIILSKLLQQLRYGKKDIFRIAIAIVFVKTPQILSDNIYTLEESTFNNVQLPITFENCNQKINVIARLYYKYI